MFILLLVSAVAMGTARGQSVSTMGRDFWIAFLDNNDLSQGLQGHKVLVSGATQCSVTLTNPNTGWSTTASVVPYVVTTINVPVEQCHNSTSNQVKNLGLHLTATEEVSVYTSMTGTYSYDVANIYPTPALRDEYMILTYPSDQYPNEFCFVAVEDSTYVDIVFHGHSRFSEGDTLSVLLENSGQVYQVKSGSVGSYAVDFSGTKVKTRDCKKIAVFHGSQCLYVPDWNTGNSCDHVMEQAIPTAYWGKDFIVMGSHYPLADRVRVTSLRDSCEVTRDGVVQATLGAGESYNYEMGVSDHPAYIHTSQPASVNVYFASTGNALGDPSMVTVNPVEQMVKRITFASFNTEYTTTHYINVVVKTEDIAKVMLNGSSMANRFGVSQQNGDYAYANIFVSQGSHTLETTGGAGIVAYAFGMGLHESYAYSLGSSMRDLARQMSINDKVNAGLDDTVGVCLHESVRFAMFSDFQCDSVVWTLGDGQGAVGDTIMHTYDSLGVYDITAYLYRTEALCGQEVDTVRSFVQVNKGDTLAYDTAVCGLTFVWYDSVYTSDGDYTQYYLNEVGCGSRRDISLTFLPDIVAVRTVWGCDRVVYNGVVYNDGDTLTDGVYISVMGCDSIDRILFRTHPTYDKTDYVTIAPGDSLLWIDGKIYYSATNEPKVTYHTIYGCDSIIRLHLTVGVLPREDSLALWVPNAFTPDESTNNLFRIFGYDILEARVYIFSRWGEYIVDFDGLTGSWDGKRKGSPCPQGAYVYMVEYTSKTKPKYTERKIGTVTLIR